MSAPRYSNLSALVSQVSSSLPALERRMVASMEELQARGDTKLR